MPTKVNLQRERIVASIIGELHNLAEFLLLDGDSPSEEATFKADDIQHSLSAWWQNYRLDFASNIPVRHAVEHAIRSCRAITPGNATMPRPEHVHDVANRLEQLVANGGTAVDSRVGDDATNDEKAVALLVNHPDWTNKQIAAQVPCHVKTLNKSNMVKFKAARKALAEGRENYGQGVKSDRRRRSSNIGRRESADDV
jgi:hypothetical protein